MNNQNLKNKAMGESFRKSASLANPRKATKKYMKERFVQGRFIVKSSSEKKRIDKWLKIHPIHPILALFEILKSQWVNETRVQSAPELIFSNESYQQIIGLGDQALPLILQSLESERLAWSWALRAISREDPVPASARGNVEETRQYWLQWGRSKGLL